MSKEKKYETKRPTWESLKSEANRELFANPSRYHVEPGTANTFLLYDALVYKYGLDATGNRFDLRPAAWYGAEQATTLWNSQNGGES